MSETARFVETKRGEAPVDEASLRSRGVFDWLAILVLAFALRALHLEQLAGDPWLELPMGDAAVYDQWARELASGEAASGAPRYLAPLYPHVLGVLYSLGLGPAGARLVQALLGAAACALVAAATRRWSGRAAGWVAGLAMALFAPAWFHEAQLAKSALSTFGIALLVWLWSRLVDPRRASDEACARDAARARDDDRTSDETRTSDAPRASGAKAVHDSAERSRARRWRSPSLGLALGVVLALTTQAREQSWALVPLVALALVLRRSRAHSLSAAVGFAIGLLLGLVPFAVGQARAGAGFTLGSGNLGPNLYLGNHAGADGLYASLAPGRGRADAERADTIRIAEEALGRPLDVAEVSDFWRARAIDWIASEPGAAFALWIRKLRLAVHGREWMDTLSFEAHVEHSPLARALARVARFSWLFAFACCGAWAAFEARRRAPVAAARAGAAGGLGARADGGRRPGGEHDAVAKAEVGARTGGRPGFPPFSLGVFALALWFAIALFFVTGRFRLALVPLVAPWAAAGAHSLLIELRAGRFARAGRALAIGVLAALWTSLDPGVREHPLADSYNNLGVALREAGRPEEALRAFDRALDARPDMADALFNRGRLRCETGQEELGRADLLEAVRGEPSYRGDAHVVMARARLAAGDLDAARRILELAIAEDARAAGAHLQLGSVLRRLGQYGAAEAAYRRALELEPAWPATHNDLGFLLAGLGRVREALAEYERALALDPDLDVARVNLAWLLAASPDRAQRRPERALALADALLVASGGTDPERIELRSAALASAGRFAEAAAEASRAARVALERGDRDTAARCDARAAAYRAGREWGS